MTAELSDIIVEHDEAMPAGRGPSASGPSW